MFPRGVATSIMSWFSTMGKVCLVSEDLSILIAVFMQNTGSFYSFKILVKSSIISHNILCYEKIRPLIRSGFCFCHTFGMTVLDHKTTPHLIEKMNSIKIYIILILCP